MPANHYRDDWSQLWWVRADGTATIHHGGTELERGRELLGAKHPQYRSVRLDGPMIVIDVDRWASREALTKP